MFHRARSSLFLAGASMWPLTAGAQTLPQQIAQYTFADGTADGWTAFFDASAPAYSAAATEDPGTGSLLTTVNYTSSGGGGGPALQLTNLIPGATYTITGYVMLTPGETASDTNFTIQRQDPGCSGGTCYDTIGAYQVPVTATGWAQIGGTYTVSTTETSLLLYAQLSPSATPTTPQSQTWTITATNPSEATAYDTEINGAFVFQVRGAPCRAILTPPSKYPVALSDVGAGGSASASFTVQFKHCRDDARFVLFAPWSANVYEMGTLVEKNLQP